MRAFKRNAWRYTSIDSQITLFVVCGYGLPRFCLRKISPKSLNNKKLQKNIITLDFHEVLTNPLAMTNHKHSYTQIFLAKIYNKNRCGGGLVVLLDFGVLWHKRFCATKTSPNLLPKLPYGNLIA
ncbi:hypothetical protein [Helicobacter sp. T3_23-1059]